MATKQALKIDVGSRYDLVAAWESGGSRVDLTGYSAKMHIRDRYNGSILVECSTANGRITFNDRTVDGSSVGVIRVHIPAAATEDLLTSLKSGVYDLELMPAGEETNPIRFLEGTVTFRPQVTE